MIPILHQEGIDAATPGTLSSKADVIRLAFHHVDYNLTGFGGINTITCNIEGGKAGCQGNSGCVVRAASCLLDKVKQ